MDAAVDGGDADASHQRSDARVRVQREQRGCVHHAEKRARPGGGQAPAAGPDQERRRSRKPRSSSAKKEATGKEVKFAAAVVHRVARARVVRVGVAARAAGADGRRMASTRPRRPRAARRSSRCGAPSATAKCSKARPVHHSLATSSSDRATSSRSSDLFDKIRATMPADAPGTLEPPQVADLVAFILQANKFPAGRAELGAGGAALRQITLGRRQPACPRRRQPDRRRRRSR